MVSLKEKFISSLTLTNNQKMVIAKIVSAPTPKVAAEDISRGSNLAAARDMLARLELIDFRSSESATLTDKGQQIAQSENIIDDSGQLTDAGQKLIGGPVPSSVPDLTAAPETPSTEPTADSLGTATTPPMESFSLIKKLSS